MSDKIYLPDEIAIRFKHKLVSIHSFPNGNGRHSRLIADIIIEKLYNQSIFSWGATMHTDEYSRTAYLKAKVKTYLYLDSRQFNYTELIEIHNFLIITQLKWGKGYGPNN